jgi:hypothetical protein
MTGKVPETNGESPECLEGPEAFARFDATMKALLAVPHAVIVKREREYAKRSKANPNRRGPKPKGGPL